MPKLPRQGEPVPERVRNRKCLGKLRPVNARVDHFVEECVGIIMKTFYICAGKHEHGISRATQIKLRHSAVVDSSKIAHCNRGVRSFSMMDDTLDPEENFCRSVLRLFTTLLVVDEWFGSGQEFESSG